MPREHRHSLSIERLFTDIAPSGVPVRFHFEGLTGGQEVSFTLSAGGDLTGALYSAPVDAKVTGNVLSFTTPPSSKAGPTVWIEFDADVQLFKSTVSGSLSLDEPATLRLTIPNTNVSTTLKGGPFSLDLGFAIPPTCILQYDRYALAEHPCTGEGNFARNLYMWHGHFYCCIERPFLPEEE